MENRERAKNYQKKLYAAAGRTWDESHYRDYWNNNFMGNEWDKFYDTGLLENDFCAWCGNDELKSGYYLAPRFSMRNVHVSICDECFMKATGGNVQSYLKANRGGCFGMIAIMTLFISILACL